MPKFKSTHEVIAACSDARTKIESVREVFDDHFARSFPEVFATAMRQSAASYGDSGETLGALKHYLSEITQGLDKAHYLLAEMITELDVARRKAAGSSASTFTI